MTKIDRKKISGKYFSLEKIKSPSIRSRNKKNKQRLFGVTYQLIERSLKRSSKFKAIQVCQ
jgi:hypothetical protein